MRFFSIYFSILILSCNSVLSQKMDQSIIFNPIPTQFLGQPPILLKAESSAAGLLVSYQSSNTNVATIEGPLLIIHGAGSTIITASQSGNVLYNPAPPVEQTLRVEDVNTQPRLIGTTFGGGFDGGGGVFSIDPSTGARLVSHYFFERDFHPTGGILNTSDGLLYGTSRAGGKNNLGVLYQYNLIDKRLLKIFHFNNDSGYLPMGALLESSQGELLCVTSKGGKYDRGTIIKIKKDGTGFAKLFDFTGQYGETPGSGLIESSNGYYYGTTIKGGFYNNGIIYRISKDGTQFNRLHSFNGEDGAEPGELFEASNGIIYGGTNSGGNFSYGIIYSISPDGSDFKILYRPELNDYYDGVRFGNKFTEVDDGMIFGTTMGGGTYGNGILFRLNMSDNSYEKIFTFGDNSSGSKPNSNLIAKPNGKLIGITLTGGFHKSGTIYEVDKNGENFRTLHYFDSIEAKHPNQILALDENSNIYGSSNLGGPNNAGTIFKFDTNQNQFSILHSGCINGCLPTSAPILTEQGNIYGTTQRGGKFGNGIVYKISKSGEFERLIEFSGNNGAWPSSAEMLLGTDGYIYGMTSTGGTQGAGIIYRINTTTDMLELVHDFASVPYGGAHPYTSLIEASDGKLYGATTYGGHNGDGNIFKIEKNGSGFSVLKDLSVESGNIPHGGLIEGSDGFLYGTASRGGTNNFGVIFRISKSGNEYKKLYDLNSVDGTGPKMPLLEIENGLLIGVTEAGGTLNRGTIFSIHKDGSNFQVIHNFSPTTGANPASPLIKLPYGEYLYGITRNSGPSQYTQGIIYRIRKDGTGYSLLHTFDNLSNPSGLSLINQHLITSIHHEPINRNNIEIFPNPSKDNFVLKIGTTGGTNTEIICRDLLGRIIFHHVYNNDEDRIEFGNSLQTGLYIVRIRIGNMTESIKLIKE